MARPLGELRDRIRLLEAELRELRREEAALTAPGSGDFQVLVCRAGTHRLAIPYSRLREVVLVPGLAPLPEAPPWVLGLLNLRGETLPVVDVQARLSGAARVPEIDDHVAVVETDDGPAGLVVTAVSSVAVVNGRDVAPAPRDVPYAPYVIGVLTLDGAPVPLVDPPSLVGLALGRGGGA